MRYVSVEDLVHFAFENKWMYCEHVEDLRPFIEEGIAQGKVRSMDTDCSDGIDRLEYLEKRVSKLENDIARKEWKNYVSSNYTKKFDVKPIRFDLIIEAEYTLKMMRKRLKEQKVISVAHYYLLATKPEYISYGAYNYGWTNLDDVNVYSYMVKGGKRVWGLVLPDPLPIESY